MADQKTDPYTLSREAFDAYCAFDAPKLPSDRLSALQVQLCRWQTRNFGAQPDVRNVLGMAEELGELIEGVLGLAVSIGKVAHSTLKHEQKIRGMADDETFRRAVADAIADTMVFTMQLCTNLRMDFGTLFEQTAKHVLERDWKARPVDAHNGQ